MLGLKHGWNEKIEYSRNEAVEIFTAKRSEQIPAEEIGLSCMEQVGFYKGTEEPSLKFIILHNSEQESWVNFKKNIRILVECLAESLNQKEVYLSFYLEENPSEFLVCEFRPK